MSQKVKTDKVSRQIGSKNAPYERKESTYSRMSSRINTASSQFGGFQVVKAKKTTLKDQQMSLRVPIDDTEINRYVEKILRRQDQAQKMDDNEMSHMSFYEKMNQTKDSRRMKKFDKVLKLWKKDNNRVSIKLKRPLQDLLCTKAEYFRRKQEILDVIESKKSPSEA